MKNFDAFIEDRREAVILEWIELTEIPAPSGHEQRRAAYLKPRFETAGLEDVSIDKAGNVFGIWRGEAGGRTVVLSAHMDTVFQDVWEIEVKREGHVLKAPGIGDDTASLINLLWVLRAMKAAGFEPRNTYVFLATVGEETGFDGMRAFLDSYAARIDLILALDGDLGGVHYGALGFGGGRITFRGPGAHTMLSRGVPNPNLAAARAIDRIYRLSLPSEPLEKWTILNVGMIGGGLVGNAVAEESFFTIDLRSTDQEMLLDVQSKVRRIIREVAADEGVDVAVELEGSPRAAQIEGAGDSFLVKTVVDILRHLGVHDIQVDPLGSTEANVGIERGILSVNLGRTYGRHKHTLQEEADIEGLFLAQKQIGLLVACLETLEPRTDR